VWFHLFVYPCVPIVYEGDHMYFIQDAWRMYRGEALYRDFFEYTFPGTQLVYLGLMYLFGTKFWLINAVIFIQAITQAVLGLLISRRIFGDSWYAFLASALFLFLGFRWFGIDGSHRMLSPIFVWLGLLVLLTNRSYARLAIAAACYALATYFTQPRGIMALAATGLFLAIEAYKERHGWRRLLLGEALLCGTFLAVMTALILPFVISAGPATFFDYTVVFLRDYVKEPTANYGAYLVVLEKILEQGAAITAVSLFYYLLIPWAFVIALVVMWRKGYRPDVLLVTLVGLGLAGGTFAPTPLRLYQICLAGLIVFAWLLYTLAQRSEFLPKLAVAGLVLIGLGSPVRVQTSWTRTYLETPTGRVAFLSTIPMERYKWLMDNASPGEPVFEVYQTAVNYILQHPNPTRMTFLLDNGYTPQWQVDAALEDVEKKRPRFIIWDGNWSKPAGARSSDDHLAPFYAYLTGNYQMKEAFTPYVDRKMEMWELTPPKP
jgi:hypothetical protein